MLGHKWYWTSTLKGSDAWRISLWDGEEKTNWRHRHNYAPGYSRMLPVRFSR